MLSIVPFSPSPLPQFQLRSSVHLAFFLNFLPAEWNSLWYHLLQSTLLPVWLLVTHSSYNFSLNTLDDSLIAQRKKPKLLRPSSSSKIPFQTYLLRSFCLLSVSQTLEKCFSLSYFHSSFSLECPSHPCKQLESYFKVQLKHHFFC